MSNYKVNNENQFKPYPWFSIILDEISGIDEETGADNPIKYIADKDEM